LNQVVNQHAVEIKNVVQRKEQEHETALKEQKRKHQNLLEQHEATKKNLSAEIQTLALTNNATKKETDGCMKEVLDQHAVEIKTIIQKKEQEHATALNQATAAAALNSSNAVVLVDQAHAAILEQKEQEHAVALASIHQTHREQYAAILEENSMQLLQVKEKCTTTLTQKTTELELQHKQTLAMRTIKMMRHSESHKKKHVCRHVLHHWRHWKSEEQQARQLALHEKSLLALQQKDAQELDRFNKTYKEKLQQRDQTIALLQSNIQEETMNQSKIHQMTTSTLVEEEREKKQQIINKMKKKMMDKDNLINTNNQKLKTMQNKHTTQSKSLSAKVQELKDMQDSCKTLTMSLKESETKNQQSLIELNKFEIELNTNVKNVKNKFKSELLKTKEDHDIEMAQVQLTMQEMQKKHTQHVTTVSGEHEQMYATTLHKYNSAEKKVQELESTIELNHQQLISSHQMLKEKEEKSNSAKKKIIELEQKLKQEKKEKKKFEKNTVELISSHQMTKMEEKKSNMKSKQLEIEMKEMHMKMKETAVLLEDQSELLKKKQLQMKALNDKNVEMESMNGYLLENEKKNTEIMVLANLKVEKLQTELNQAKAMDIENQKLQQLQLDSKKEEEKIWLKEKEQHQKLTSLAQSQQEKMLIELKEIKKEKQKIEKICQENVVKNEKLIADSELNHQLNDKLIAGLRTKLSTEKSNSMERTNLFTKERVDLLQKIETMNGQYDDRIIEIKNNLNNIRIKEIEQVKVNFKKSQTIMLEKQKIETNRQNAIKLVTIEKNIVEKERKNIRKMK